MFVHIRPDGTPQIGGGFLIEAKMNISVDTSVADVVGDLFEPSVWKVSPGRAAFIIVMSWPLSPKIRLSTSADRPY